MDRIAGTLLSVDYVSAFNSLEYDFMIYAFEFFNFGLSLIILIRLLYSGVFSVSNNGYTSE